MLEKKDKYEYVLSDKQIDYIIEKVEDIYKNEQKELSNIYKIGGEGQARYSAGELTEKVLQSIFDNLNKSFNENIFISKRGIKDFLSSKIKYKNDEVEIKNLQVDRHIYINKDKNEQKFGFIENKTYLDACYYDRALNDFKKIIYSLNSKNEQINNIKFIVFSGQSALSDKKRKYLEILFKYELSYVIKNVDIDIDVFYYLKEKKRSSDKPIYSTYFELDKKEIKRFILKLINKLNGK